MNDNIIVSQSPLDDKVFNNLFEASANPPATPPVATTPSATPVSSVDNSNPPNPSAPVAPVVPVAATPTPTPGVTPSNEPAAFVFNDTVLDTVSNTTDPTGTPAANPNSTPAIPATPTPSANPPSGTNAASLDVLKNTMDYLIEKELWADFPGRAETTLTEETWAELAEKQAIHTARTHLQSIVASLPEDSQRFFNYISNGGDASKVAELYIAKNNVLQLNPQTIEDKTNYVRAYYNSLQWSQERINATIDRLKAGGDVAIESEFKEVDPLYKKIYDERIQNEERIAHLAKQDQAERDAAFTQNITNAIVSRKDMSREEKEMIYDFFVNHDQVLPDGRKMNKFFAAFAKTQQSIPDYLELGEFLLDKEKYLTRKLQGKQTTAVNKGFSFLTSTSGGAIPTAEPTPVKAAGTNFLI